MPPQSVDLVGCSASNFPDAAHSLARLGSRRVRGRRRTWGPEMPWPQMRRGWGCAPRARGADAMLTADVVMSPAACRAVLAPAKGNGRHAGSEKERWMKEFS